MIGLSTVGSLVARWHTNIDKGIVLGPFSRHWGVEFELL